MTDNKMLKGGDERPHGMWWVVSFSPPRCEFSPTSQVERATMRGVYGALVDRITCGGLAEGPLVWLSICACVELVAKTEMRTVVLGK